MTSRFLSLLLTACLFCVGFTAAAKPSLAAPVVGEHGVVSSEPGGAESLFATVDELPITPSAPLDRDGAVDQPELFDPLRRAAGPANAAPAPPSIGPHGPAAPYLQGLRRPPRCPSTA